MSTMHHLMSGPHVAFDLASAQASVFSSAIIGLLVSAEVVHKKTLLPHSAEAEAERQKMVRLRKLRLEKEAAEKSAVASRAVMETELAVLLRERPDKYIPTNLKATPRQLNRGTSGSTPRTLSEWLTQQKRDGGRY